jgi:hypothetical protein
MCVHETRFGHGNHYALYISESCVLRNTGINIYYFTGKINMVKKVCKPHNCNYFFFNYLNYFLLVLVEGE